MDDHKFGKEENFNPQVTRRQILKWTVGIAGAVAFAPLLTACGTPTEPKTTTNSGVQPATTPRYGGTLRIADQYDGVSIGLPTK